MNPTHHAAPGPDTTVDRARRRGLAALCTTEITSWGVLYYAFPVLVGTIGADTGWSNTTIMGAFSIGLAVSAVAGIPVGRLLDRHGPRPIMTTGSVLGVLSLVGIALAPNPWIFAAAWAVSGIAQACVFYKPAFAALTGWYGPSRVKALTALTLVAGLASTVFAPLTATLADHTSWRATYLILAALLAVITIPAHAIFLAVPWKPHHLTETDETPRPATRTILVSVPFLVLVAVTTTAAFALFTATINLVPMLTEHGTSTSFAAWALGLCGAGQLLGRIGYARFTAKTSVRLRTMSVCVAAGLAMAATASAASQPIALIIAAIVFGATRGVFTLLEATAISDRWGTGNFGTLYGIYSAPSTIAMAVTPFAGALLAGWLGGNRALFLTMTALLLLAGLGAVATIPKPARTDHPVSQVSGTRT